MKFEKIKRNMGVFDRILRILIFLTIVILSLTNIISGTLSYILLALGVVFLITSFAGFCPLYTLFGLKTCKTNNDK